MAYNDGTGIVIMTNSDNGGQLIGEILRTIAREYEWPDFAPVERVMTKVDAQIFDRYVGAYRMNENATIQITREGDQLFQQRSGQGRTSIFP